jgi:hypothetical protein
MFGWIIGSSLKFFILVAAIAAALLIFGTEQLRKMPVNVFPEFAPLKIEIQTEGPGITAANEARSSQHRNRLRDIQPGIYIELSINNLTRALIIGSILYTWRLPL